ncbi:tetratricopeptide repeat protein [Stieleria varia]|uniref:tetratricopeptide repeat protein n=1 Tax=Stieleria varia TaxID=2528005 RepID=UPI0018D23BB9|nr:tetratricopeptide repeat protein [Stieleria varia]
MIDQNQLFIRWRAIFSYCVVAFVVAFVVGCSQQGASPAVSEIASANSLSEKTPNVSTDSASGAGSSDFASDANVLLEPPTTGLAEPVVEPDPAGLHMDGLLALQRGDVQVAYEKARQAMRLRPDDPQVIFLMAMVLGKRNRFPEAIKMLDELAETTPSLRLPVMGQTAEWMVQSGQWQEAERRYRKVMVAVPESVQVHRNLAGLLSRQGHRINAAEHLASLCELGDVTEEELRFLLMIAFPFPGDADEIDPIGVLGASRCDLASGAWQSVRERLESHNEIDAVESALLGRTLANLNDLDALEAWVANAADSDEGHPDAWFARGVFAANQGEHDRAVRCFCESVLLDQTDHQAYLMLGQSLAELGANEDAERVLHRSSLIERTQVLGAKMASTELREDAALTELIGLLNQLHRPLEALGWRGVQIGYSQGNSSTTDSDTQRILEEIVVGRSKVLSEGHARPSREFILCGIDVDSLPQDESNDL